MLPFEIVLRWKDRDLKDRIMTNYNEAFKDRDMMDPDEMNPDLIDEKDVVSGWSELEDE